MSEQCKQAKEPRTLRSDSGIAYGGQNYHLHDFVLFKAQEGPANIGYISKVSPNAHKFRVRLVGRIGSIEDALPNNVMRDEVCILNILFVHL